MPKKSRKVLMTMMKAVKLGWAGAGQEQGRSRAGAGQDQSKIRAEAGAGIGAGQEQGRSRAEQSKAEQGRKRAGPGQKLGRSKECVGSDFERSRA